MKSRLHRLLVALVTLLCALPALAATYTFRSDSFAWETSNTAITWARACTGYPGDDDQATITFTGGFVFRFAGVAYTSLRVLANGALQFGADTGFMRTYTNTTLPAGAAGARSGCAAAATARTIMAYWTDLNPSASGSGGVTWQQKGLAPNRYVVISWNNVYQYGTATPYTFQIILFENGEFKFQYGNANASGSNATIGVQVAASDYTLYSYNSGYNANGSAIRWFVGTSSPTRVAEYRFDEHTWNGTLGEVRDSSGNNRDGVRVGSAAPVAGGYVCRALSVAANTNGSAHAVDTLVNPAGMLGSNGGFTMWVRSNVAWSSSTAAMLLDASSNGSDSFFLMRAAGGALRFVLNDSGSGALAAATTAITTGAGTWVHVGVAWHLASGTNQSSLRIYVNGVLRATTLGSTTGALDPALRSIFVGDNRGTGTANGATLNSANGLLDELRFYNYEIGLAEIATDMAATHSCVPPVDHYEVALPSSTLACLGSTVTVTACADSSSPCTSPSGAVAGQTATLTASGAAALGSPTLLFNSGGVASTTLSYPLATDGAVVSVSLSNEQTAALNARRCCPDGTTCAAANSCSTVFATAGFAIAASAGGPATTVVAQTAGTASAAHNLRAVKSGSNNGACEAALVGPQTVEWASQCNNPATCSSGNRMTITGTAPNAVPGNPATGVSSYGNVAMSFDNAGNASFNFNFADVGQVSLFIRKAAAGLQTTPLMGRSNAYVTRPAGLALGSVRQTASPQRANPGAADANGAVFVPAGEAFSATVTAVGSTGLVTPNFGRESPAQGVTLATTLLQPAGGSAGTLSGGTLAGANFSGGVASTTTLAYSEVGIVRLEAAVSANSYLGAATANAVAGVTVGRFRPARFAIGAASVSPRIALGCAATPAFGYLDENFGLGLTLVAQSASSSTTRNYSGSFAKLDPNSATGWNLAAVDGATRFLPGARLALGSASGAWSAGSASVNLTAQATRGTAPDGPFNTAIGIAPVDSDGVALVAHDLDADAAVAGSDRTQVGSLALRFGRLRLLSATGAADRVLDLPVLAEHWNGSAFATNTLDDCSTVPATAVSFGKLRRTLTAADTAAAGAITLAAGRGRLRLAAPGGGRSGTVDVALSLGSSATDVSCQQPWTPASGDAATTGANLPYLRAAWCSTSHDKDPTARASFGLPRGADVWLDRRENY
jgi:MSHA biogenesis protein MshQ